MTIRVRRIVAVGLSNDGVMAQHLGCAMADRLAGVVANEEIVRFLERMPRR